MYFICIAAAVICCIFAVWNSQAFVVTKYDPKTIAYYFEHLQNYSNRRTANPFTNRSLFEFCQLLRLSKVFRSVTPEQFHYRDNQEFNISEYQISEETLIMEKDQLEIGTKRFRIGTTPSRIKRMPSFKCLDENEDLRWYVTPSFIPESYFLFNHDPEFHYVMSREIDTNAEYYPTLMAIIDEPAKFTEDSRDDRIEILQEKFIKSLEHRKTNEICKLNSVMRFRLCAIVGDASGPTRRFRPTNDFTSIRMFPRQPENLHYHTRKPNEYCPLISINGMNVSGRMLDCRIHLVTTGTRFNFFLSYNLNEKSKVYMVRTIETIPLSYIQELEIPLVMYINDHEETRK